MRAFDIVYAAGTPHSGKTRADWLNLDSDGVQAVVVLHDDGCARAKLYGFDYYALQASGQIVGSDRARVGDVKVGSLMPTDAYDDIIDRLNTRSKIWSGEQNE